MTSFAFSGPGITPGSTVGIFARLINKEMKTDPTDAQKGVLTDAFLNTADAKGFVPLTDAGISALESFSDQKNGGTGTGVTISDWHEYKADLFKKLTNGNPDADICNLPVASFLKTGYSLNPVATPAPAATPAPSPPGYVNPFDTQFD